MPILWNHSLVSLVHLGQVIESLIVWYWKFYMLVTMRTNHHTRTGITIPVWVSILVWYFFPKMYRYRSILDPIPVWLGYNTEMGVGVGIPICEKILYVYGFTKIKTTYVHLFITKNYTHTVTV